MARSEARASAFSRSLGRTGCYKIIFHKFGLEVVYYKRESISSTEKRVEKTMCVLGGFLNKVPGFENRNIKLSNVKYSFSIYWL